MTVLVALFPSYLEAHLAAQQFISQGFQPQVTYHMARGNEGGDGSEGFYPKLTPDVVTPQGGNFHGVDPQAHIFSGESGAGRFAPTGSDNLTVSPPLRDRLIDLGIGADDVQAAEERVIEGQVLGVFVFEGQSPQRWQIDMVLGNQLLSANV